MTDQRDRLTRYGRALYGDRWQSALAHDLGVNARRLRAWLYGERPIPAGVWADIAELLRQRGEAVADVLNELTENASTPPATPLQS